NRLVVEALGDDEVQIAVFGVPENYGVAVLMLAEQYREILRRISQTLDGKRHVFDDDRGATLAHRANRREHDRKNLPQQGLLGSEMGELRRLVQLEPACRVRRDLLQFRALPLLRRLKLRQQSGG